MRRTIRDPYVARRLVAAIVLAVGVFGLSLPARAQLAVVDNTAIGVLQSILAELQSHTTILNNIHDKTTEIKSLNDDILAAICGKSTISQQVAIAEDLDFSNISLTALTTFQESLPEGITPPNPGDLEAILSATDEVFGLINEAEAAAATAQRTYNTAEQTFENLTSGDVNRTLRTAKWLSRRGVQLVKDARGEALIESVRSNYSFSTYSLNQGANSKGREVSLNQARAGANCLREDVNASNQTMLEVLKRTNHLITLMGKANAMSAAEALGGLPISSEIIEEE